MKVSLFLLLLLLAYRTTAFAPSAPVDCVNILKFVEVIVPSKDRKALIARWRVFLNNRLKNNSLTQMQYNTLRDEILEAKQIIDRLEAKGYRNNHIINSVSLRCSI